MESDLPPDEVVRRLQSLTGSRNGFTAFDLYDLGITGRVWADQFQVKRLSSRWRRAESRTLLLRIEKDGGGSKLSGNFSVEPFGFVLITAWMGAMSVFMYRDWKGGRLDATASLIGLLIWIVPAISYWQLRRSLREESRLLRFVEETLCARIVSGD